MARYLFVGRPFHGHIRQNPPTSRWQTINLNDPSISLKTYKTLLCASWCPNRRRRRGRLRGASPSGKTFITAPRCRSLQVASVAILISLLYMDVWFHLMFVSVRKQFNPQTGYTVVKRQSAVQYRKLDLVKKRPALVEHRLVGSFHQTDSRRHFSFSFTAVCLCSKYSKQQQCVVHLLYVCAFCFTWVRGFGGLTGKLCMLIISQWF